MTPETMTRPPRWWTHAACANADVSLFFADGRGKLDQACAYCQRCPVAVDCLADARARGEETGVWGGVIFHKVPRR
jgi:WhiB family transcriptional regulator, redox-sensing transcriptional regulator